MAGAHAHPVLIEDLHSANGVRVHGDALPSGQPTPMPVGESIELGGAIVMLQRRPLATREWRIWAHGYFEARLEEECTRAARATASFALLRLSLGPESRPEIVQQVLANTLRADDVVGIYGPGDYEAMLVDRSEAEAAQVVSSLESAFQEVGLKASIALAMVACAVMMTIGVSMPPSRARLSTERPSRSGILRSMKATSTPRSIRRPSASDPFSA